MPVTPTCFWSLSQQHVFLVLQYRATSRAVTDTDTRTHGAAMERTTPCGRLWAGNAGSDERRSAGSAQSSARRGGWRGAARMREMGGCTRRLAAARAARAAQAGLAAAVRPVSDRAGRGAAEAVLRFPFRARG